MAAFPILTHENILLAPEPLPVPEISIGQFILEALKSNGTDVALVDSQTGHTATFQDVLRESVSVAQALKSRGARLGDVIGICSENRFEFAPAAVGIGAVGATVAPLNPIYTVGELEHAMSISQPKMVFCSPFTYPKLEELKPKMPFLELIIVFGEVTTEDNFVAFNDLLKGPANPNFQCTAVNPHHHVAVVLCSSGTTGLPKVVELTHHNLLSVLSLLGDTRCTTISNSDVLLGLIPFFHGYGFGVLMLSLVKKIKVIVMSSFQEDHFLASIQNHKVTRLFAVPPMMVFLAKHPLVSKFDLSSIKEIICGAAPLSRDVQMAVQERIKISNIKQGYGMTEMSIACTIIPPGFTKEGSSGVPAPGLKCKVVDTTTGKALPPYKEGELCFYGSFVMKGYRNNPAATAEMIERSGWLHTGDIAYYDNEGFIYIVDRLKELIKYKGFQVPPAELEALLLTHPGVNDSAVIGLPDEEAGELPLAFIVKQPGQNVTEEDIKQFVASRVSPQKRLHGGVRFVEAIPKNPSGKILRKELRAIIKSKL